MVRLPHTSSRVLSIPCTLLAGGPANHLYPANSVSGIVRYYVYQTQRVYTVALSHTRSTNGSPVAMATTHYKWCGAVSRSGTAVAGSGGGDVEQRDSDNAELPKLFVIETRIDIGNKPQIDDL